MLGQNSEGHFLLHRLRRAIYILPQAHLLKGFLFTFCCLGGIVHA